MNGLIIHGLKFTQKQKKINYKKSKILSENKDIIFYKPNQRMCMYTSSPCTHYNKNISLEKNEEKFLKKFNQFFSLLIEKFLGKSLLLFFQNLPGCMLRIIEIINLHLNSFIKCD